MSRFPWPKSFIFPITDNDIATQTFSCRNSEQLQRLTMAAQVSHNPLIIPKIHIHVLKSTYFILLAVLREKLYNMAKDK